MDYTSYELPVDFKEMDAFLEKNKLVATEHVVTAIQYAVEHNMDIISVFSFKDSQFVITLHKDLFAENLNHIYNDYISSEKYELCGRITSINSKLKNSSKNYEKNKTR